MELLAAVLILSVVAAGAVATWSFSSRAPANKRFTEVASLIAVREIEKIKAQKYINAAAPANPDWYDQSGAFLSTAASAPSGAVFKAVITLGVPVDVNGTALTTSTGTTKDLLEVVVKVWNAAGTKSFETQRTLLSFGGL